MFLKCTVSIHDLIVYINTFVNIFFRYSLNDKIKPIPPPLISVDTSHSISSASENGLPAVYGVPVHSRPSSRYSNRSHRNKRDRSQPPPQSSLHAYQSHSSSSGGSSAQYSKYSNGRMIIKWEISDIIKRLNLNEKFDNMPNLRVLKNHTFIFIDMITTQGHVPQ